MTNPPSSVERLDEFTADEWFDVARRINPKLSRTEFDEDWTRFQADKTRKALS